MSKRAKGGRGQKWPKRIAHPSDQLFTDARNKIRSLTRTLRDRLHYDALFKSRLASAQEVTSEFIALDSLCREQLDALMTENLAITISTNALRNGVARRFGKETSLDIAYKEMATVSPEAAATFVSALMASEAELLSHQPAKPEVIITPLSTSMARLESLLSSMDDLGTDMRAIAAIRERNGWQTEGALATFDEASAPKVAQIKTGVDALRTATDTSVGRYHTGCAQWTEARKAWEQR